VVRAPVKPLLLPASIAGLLQSVAMVRVDPPLFCRPFGSSFGSSGEATVPVLSEAAVKPALPSRLPIKLKPAETKFPKTSGPENAAVFIAMSELFTFTVPELFAIPPPLLVPPVAALATIVLFVTLIMPPLSFRTPPPLNPPVFPLIVLLVMFMVPKFSIPPVVATLRVVLPLTVLSLRFSVPPPLKMAPPPEKAKLPVNTQLRTDNVPPW
jgi:hypothetical protein